MESPRRKKKYYGYRIQPRRLAKSKAEPSDVEELCLIVGAFNMFKDYACISANECDIELRITMMKFDPSVQIFKVTCTNGISLKAMFLSLLVYVKFDDI